MKYFKSAQYYKNCSNNAVILQFFIVLNIFNLSTTVDKYFIKNIAIFTVAVLQFSRLYLEQYYLYVI